MENTLYDYSPIVDRQRLEWPGGAKVAFWVGLNVEHYKIDRPSMSIAAATAGLSPDPLNYGWRDYGPRVGVWRMMEVFDRHSVRASVLLNSEVCERYPRIVEAGNERNWAWLAHGRHNSEFHSGMEVEEERRVLGQIVADLEKGTGHRPRGWLGPSLTETYETARLLSELGLTYILDWCNDDQPYTLNVAPERMISIPYSIEVNDITLYVSGHMSPDSIYRIMMDQLEGLLSSDLAGGQVMAIGVHPFVSGLPFRLKYLDRALKEITASKEVWVTTSDELAEYYLGHY